jgi:hypothetical protein
MRTGSITLAVVGVAACTALFALQAYPQAASFLQLTQEEDVRFNNYLAMYGKSYGTKEEFEFRKEQFLQNLAMYQEVTSQNDVTFSLGINKFADWTEAEFKRLLGKKNRSTALRGEIA